jgi:aminoglycoside/choline kinase family phosphotransferase
MALFCHRHSRFSVCLTDMHIDTSSPIAWTDPSREAAFGTWVRQIGPRWQLELSTLSPASADASFRRYFRIHGQRGSAVDSFIVMDAAPPLEDVRPFVRVAALLREAGLNVPQVLEADTDNGFLLLTDLGRQPYLQTLAGATPSQADALMRDALQALVQMQQRAPVSALGSYDEALLMRELDLFPRWCVQQHFGVAWGPAQFEAWTRVCRLLVDSALAQPVVVVHRDWMPRNLMVTDPNPGVLDLQDAVAGPITYDSASLLRDAFLSWEEEREIDWAIRGWELQRKAGLPVSGDFAEHWRQLEWMGLQRHLKVLGIFCRLQHRDGKPAYAQDLPRFFGYATRVAMRYRELAPLLPLMAPLSGQAVGAGFTF